MLPLAQLMLKNGHQVSGSDRSYDQGKLPEKFQAIQNEGIVLHAQDGSGVSDDIDMVVVSSAVEDHIPDIKKALALNLQIKKRAALLAQLFNERQGIAIAGTSGKTTVTAMAGHIFSVCGHSPTIVNGGRMINFDDQSAVIGEGQFFIAETDESDGSVALFKPAVGVLNNVAHDHKSVEELKNIFIQYLNNCQQAIVINKDNEFCCELSKDVEKPRITFSIQKEADIKALNIKLQKSGISFKLVHGLEERDISLHVPGEHNVSNALAAAALALSFGLPFEEICTALEAFKGTKRRLEIVGTTERGITIYDDFAHNPDKIAASLSTLKKFQGRLIAFFQPHGFGPTKMLKDELIDTFVSHMGDNDVLVMPEIYYAGGTVEKSISSKDVIDPIAARGRQALFFETREECKTAILEQVEEGDRIIIMGARDDSLSVLAQEILEFLSNQEYAVQM